MSVRWPDPTYTVNDDDGARRRQLEPSLDAFGAYVEGRLTALGIAPYDSLLWQPWHLAAVWDDQSLWCVFSPNTGGISETHYFDKAGATYTEALLRDRITNGLGWKQTEVIRLPLPGAANEESDIKAAADRYVDALERKTRLRVLGDLTGFEHLEPHLRAFLDDHPDPARNMFVMMRFQPSAQLIEAHQTIVNTLAARNIQAIRVDDRDYSGDLWTNIQVCMLGCHYGIALYEDIDTRDFNPNVSLEVGFMLARSKRVLLLKEKRLPSIPSDIVGKLYKPWDSYNIEKTVGDQVAHWVDVDLGLAP
jgi:hypothetical protein